MKMFLLSVVLTCVVVGLFGCNQPQSDAVINGVLSGVNQAVLQDPNSEVSKAIAKAMKDNPELAAVVAMANTVNWNDPNQVQNFSKILTLALLSKAK